MSRGMYDEATGWRRGRMRQRRRDGGRGGGVRQQRAATRTGVTITTMPLPPLELTAAEALSDSDPEILFEFWGEEYVATAVDTLILCSPSSPGVI